MYLLSKDELKTLMESNDKVAVSLYIPTERAGDRIEQNPIRFKNVVRTAEDRLRQEDVRDTDIEKILKPARSLVENSPFWEHQSDGLAVFLTEDDARYYRLPHAFNELAFVGKRFHLKPLLPLFHGDGRFFVLAFSKNNIRLLEGTRHSIDEVELQRVPESLAEALRFDLYEREVQFYTGTPGRGPSGKREAVFHGTGDQDRNHKHELGRYFKQVDAGIQEMLREERVPLVLAGVQYLHPIYREASSYSHILDDGITGNPDMLSAKELHDKAWQIVQPHFEKEQREANQKFEELHGKKSNLASTDLEKVVVAAVHGQVDTLYTPVGVQVWGTFDPDKMKVEVQKEDLAGNYDLLDLAAGHAVTHGGTVFAVNPDDVPGGGDIAAIFRYPSE